MYVSRHGSPYYWKCGRCGECCTSMLGKKFGPAITPYEKEVLAKLAEYHHVPFNIRPLTLDWKGQVSLWQFAEDRCSFLSKIGRCLIYDRRPLFCKMYPLNPHGLNQCPTLKQMIALKPKRILFPDEMKKACIDYIKFVVPKCKECAMRYDLNKGWEVNKPFDPGKLCDADLRYADTYQSYKL